MTPQRLRKSPSWVSCSSLQSSPANSVRSEVGESLPRATTSNAPSWRSLSRPSSSRSRRTPKSDSKGERQIQKAAPINDVSISTRALVTSSTELTRHAKPKTVWSTDDSYLPQTKPPPPLKCIKHQRNRSEYRKSPPDPTTYNQPSSFRNRTHSTASHSLPSSLDMPILDISSEHHDVPVPVVQHALTRSSTRLSITSEPSDDAHISFAPIKFGSSWKWTPPTSWAGPSKAVSADEDEGSKPVGRWPFPRKKSAESSSQGSSMQAPTGLNHTQSFNELRSVDFADVGEPENHVFGTRRSSGVNVKIQCYENHEWQEKPVVDVIPMLRELKIK